MLAKASVRFICGSSGGRLSYSSKWELLMATTKVSSHFYCFLNRIVSVRKVVQIRACLIQKLSPILLEMKTWVDMCSALSFFAWSWSFVYLGPKLYIQSKRSSKATVLRVFFLSCEMKVIVFLLGRLPGIVNAWSGSSVPLNPIALKKSLAGTFKVLVSFVQIPWSFAK